MASIDQVLALYEAIGRPADSVTPAELAYWTNSDNDGQNLATTFLTAAADYTNSAQPALAAVAQNAVDMLTTQQMPDIPPPAPAVNPTAITPVPTPAPTNVPAPHAPLVDTFAQPVYTQPVPTVAPSHIETAVPIARPVTSGDALPATGTGAGLSTPLIAAALAVFFLLK